MVNRRTLSVGALLALPVLLFACGGDPDPGPPQADGPDAPVLLLGVDGFEWGLALPLLRAGELPNLEAAIERGSVSALETLHPTWSPRIWTSVATGKEPAEHGIEDFVHYDEDRNPVSLYTQEDRRTKAHWNILSDAGLSVDTIGWWMTFPVEPVNGLMVAQTNAPIEADGSRSGPEKGLLRAGVPAQVHPASMEVEVFGRFAEVGADLDATLEGIFGKIEPYDEESAGRWSDCRWAFRADSTYLALALAQAARAGGPADVTAIYLGGSDVVGHRFFAAHQPGPFGLAEDSDEVRVFGDVVPDYYRFVDDALGRLLAAWPADTTLVLATDHGMVSLHQDVKKRGGILGSRDGKANISNTGGHPRGERGVFVLAGTHVLGGLGRPAGKPIRELVRGDLEDYGSVLDVAPTLLALVGLGAGEDMPGQVLERYLDVEAPARITTHDDAAWLEARVHTGIQPVDPSGRIDQLGDLGYLGDE